MESLGTILRRVMAREPVKDSRYKEAVAVFEAAEAAASPACPNCKGYEWISRAFVIPKGARGPGLEMSSTDIKPCPECNAPQESAQRFNTFNTDSRWPRLEEAIRATEQWAWEDGPAILILSAEPGRGKTHLAQAAVHDLRKVGRSVEYMQEAEVMDRIHAAFESHGMQSYMRVFETAKWLVINDYGLSARTPTIDGIFDRIIDYRVEGIERHSCRTLITTNLLPGKFRSNRTSADGDSIMGFSPRVESRLKGFHVKSIVINAPDYRQNPWGEKALRDM